MRYPWTLVKIVEPNPLYPRARASTRMVEAPGGAPVDYSRDTALSIAAHETRVARQAGWASRFEAAPIPWAGAA